MTAEVDRDEIAVTDGGTETESSDLAGRSGDEPAGGEGEAVGRALSVEPTSS